MQTIEFIPIAKRKCRKRGIDEGWVRETILNPDQKVKGYAGRMVAQKKYLRGGKEYLLRVVSEEHGESCIVVSAYFTSKVERYWQGKASS
ncbi:DUF4258 domain-containing protein [Acidobacteria bacterium AH-259-O06]|nr:DUF4258 domain-containing protein [Acidobacteria bacterium AH-259-O06]